MKKLITPAVYIIIGIIAGIYLYAKWDELPFNKSAQSDSILVNNAHAMTTNQNLNQITQEIDKSRQNAITRAVQIISPAVVSVNVLQVREYTRRSPFYSRDPFLREFFPELFKDQTYQQQIKSMGSGFIISEDGYILSNDHVVSDATKILITMAGGYEAEAEVVGRDPVLDVSLLKIESDNLKAVKLGDSDDVILGEWAIAVGNPFGLFDINNRSTVTLGVISALDRDFGEMEGRIYQDMIQTDASINHGNSGGPLCNALGDVIGMNTFIYTGGRYEQGSVGIGFAIPINRIKKLLNVLKKGESIDRNFWIGIKVQNLSEIISRKMGFTGTDGVLVRHIDRGSPAQLSGLELGDIIIEMNDTKIRNEDDVQEIVYGPELKVGDDLTLKVWRDGRILSLEMRLVSIRDSR